MSELTQPPFDTRDPITNEPSPVAQPEFNGGTWKCPECGSLGTQGHDKTCKRQDYPWDELREVEVNRLRALVTEQFDELAAIQIRWCEDHGGSGDSSRCDKCLHAALAASEQARAELVEGLRPFAFGTYPGVLESEIKDSLCAEFRIKTSETCTTILPTRVSVGAMRRAAALLARHAPETPK